MEEYIVTIEYIKKRKMKEKTTDIDCPLCGKKGVIFENPQKHTASFSGISSPRDYSTYPIGEEYQVRKHAKKCLAMQHIHPIHKEHYLMIFVNKNGDTSIRISDLHHYEAYVIALEKVGLKIDNKNVRTKKQMKTQNRFSDNCDWEVEMFITSINKNDVCKHGPHIIAKNPDTAFEKLKDRLICGEVIEVTDSSGKKTLFQIRSNEKEVTVITIN